MRRTQSRPLRLSAAVVLAAFSWIACGSDRTPGPTDDVPTLDEDGLPILYAPYAGEYPGAGAALVGRHCVARMNAYRARLGLDPYRRNADGERCASREARDALLAGSPTCSTAQALARRAREADGAIPSGVA